MNKIRKIWNIVIALSLALAPVCATEGMSTDMQKDVVEGLLLILIGVGAYLLSGMPVTLGFVLWGVVIFVKIIAHVLVVYIWPAIQSIGGV